MNKETPFPHCSRYLSRHWHILYLNDALGVRLIINHVRVCAFVTREIVVMNQHQKVLWEAYVCVYVCACISVTDLVACCIMMLQTLL